jgi:hypothetical protein
LLGVTALQDKDGVGLMAEEIIAAAAAAATSLRIGGSRTSEPLTSCDWFVGGVEEQQKSGVSIMVVFVVVVNATEEDCWVAVTTPHHDDSQLEVMEAMEVVEEQLSDFCEIIICSIAALGWRSMVLSLFGDDIPSLLDVVFVVYCVAVIGSKRGVVDGVGPGVDANVEMQAAAFEEDDEEDVGGK